MKMVPSGEEHWRNNPTAFNVKKGKMDACQFYQAGHDLWTMFDKNESYTYSNIEESISNTKKKEIA